MISAREALERLREGNRRYVAGTPAADPFARRARRSELVGGQEPFAVILGCSDSRVPVEIVFDLDLGDLFVIRVAGNVVASSQIGSVEFAASLSGTRLVVVLGHTQCGALAATLAELRRREPASGTKGLRAIVDRIRPAVEELVAADPEADPQALLRRAVRANVLTSVRQLRYGSPLLEQLIEHEGLMVVGAEYSLESGVVTFLDEAPRA